MSYAQKIAMTFSGKLDQIMKSRGLTNEEVAKKIRSPQNPAKSISAAYFGRLRDGTRSPSAFVLDELVKAFGAEDGPALRRAFDEERTPPVIRAELANADARLKDALDRAAREADSADAARFPHYFTVEQKRAAFAIVDAIRLGGDGIWLDFATKAFESAAHNAHQARLTAESAARAQAQAPRPLQNPA